jgi:hypothetical protein
MEGEVVQDRNRDRTIERNYLRKWRFLIPEYEAVKAGRSEAFRWVGDFYRHHGTCSQTFRKYYNRYLMSGTEDDLLPRRRGPKRRDPPCIEVKDAVFRILHSPPSDFGFNRTTWKIADLQNALKKENYLLSRLAIGTTIKKAGYRWLKAKAQCEQMFSGLLRQAKVGRASSNDIRWTIAVLSMSSIASCRSIQFPKSDPVAQL